MRFPKPAQALVICAVLAAIFVPGFMKIRAINHRNQDLAEKNRKLEVENALLKTELERLENDTVFQEKILREKMGVVRKNEVPVKLVPKE
ncbi:MAG: septum formation initiator family protein [Candidatus Omnitrophica bacterium]|nr:septum formation initiator family protein [Candidatus Omnitrophota bacterium]